MKTYIDTKFLKKGILDPSVIPVKEVFLPWPSFLEFLDLGSLIENYPDFDEKNVLFTYLSSALELDKEVVIRLYDQIFVECLTFIKSLPEIDPGFLLEKLQSKEKPSFLSFSLEEYEDRLKKDPHGIMHDLILYLAFDLVCIWIAKLFEHPSSQEEKMTILKECLIESFFHIKQDGKTSPGFFRLVETLYAYHMREENLQKYQEDEWLLLCESASSLKDRKSFIDLFYIDHSIELKTKENIPLQMLTLESEKIVQARIALASYMLREIEPSYTLLPVSIVFLDR